MDDPKLSDAPLLLKRAKFGMPGSGVPGIFSVARRLLTWTPNDPGSGLAVELAVAAIKSQQKAKARPLLRLINPGKPLQFEFDGMADLDTVIEVIAPLLQPQQAVATKAGPDAQADLKHSLLRADRDLAALHTQLVLRGILTEDEFWKGRASLLSARLPTVQQRVGLTSAMLAESQQSADGQSETIKIKLTSTMVHQIFAEKPAVKRAFQATVPTRMMTNQQFWAKYLKHQVLAQNARRREAARLPPEPAFLDGEEFFGKYERDLDNAHSTAAAGSQRQSAADDLASDQNDDLTPGYGTYHNSQKDPEHSRSSGAGHKKGLIRDINRHAEVVMGGVPESLPDDVEAAASVLAAELPAAGASGSGQQAAEGREEKEVEPRSGYGGSNLVDLRAVQPPSFSELPIQDARAAFKTAASSADGGGSGQSPVAVDSRSAAAAALESIRGIDPTRLDISMPSGMPMQVLTTAMQDRGIGGGAAQALSPPQVKHLRQLVLTVNELLRHFWACLPASTAPRQAKATRIVSALNSQFERLEDAEAASQGPERAHARQLLRPVKEAIKAASDTTIQSTVPPAAATADAND